MVEFEFTGKGEDGRTFWVFGKTLIWLEIGDCCCDVNERVDDNVEVEKPYRCWTTFWQTEII